MTESDVRKRERREAELEYCRRYFKRLYPIEAERKEREHKEWCFVLAHCLRRCF
ncbi:hypothetical protein [Adlercreutzia sp. ZJ154]|uniref:hypothetical protein n=1 Tax=Adlercreutzia sp. ZJ154 TaxID=2709790 RepID=UPI00197FAA5F|nr:hypothetical protein [Adlercreutzia sp. ZJ154]